MKTKMIFAIAALLMLGSVCLNAQGSGEGATPTDYSKQPFTIVPIEKDLRVDVWGNCGPNTCNSVKMYYSYDLGQTWKMIISDVNWFRVNVGQKLSFKIEENNARSSDGISVRNINSEDTQVGKFYVEGNLGSMMHTEDGEGYFSGMTSLVSAENLIIPDNYTCESMFSGCTSLTTAPVLSASTLTENRYKDMFKGCSKLNYIKCLATDISASGCTEGWLDGVSSSGTFVKASSMNSWPSGASGIPSGWTVTNAQNTQTKRTIHVATAGTLPNLISEEEKYQIEELTLSGELNGTDFKFIREMAGKASHFTEDTNFGSHIEWASFRNTGGKLSVIDMSGVNIISGGIYLTIYEEWTIPNVKEYIVQANEIPFFVFGGCGLTSITIPNSVTSIGIKAFCNCSGLTSIVSQIKNPFEISDDAFDSEIYSTATLTVPFGTKSIYETTNGWKNFQNIVEAPSFKRTIHVATAGTLSDLISADEKYKIEELTLTGELNGTDFVFINEMAGKSVSFSGGHNDFDVYYYKTSGKLKSINLSGAIIVSGGSPYDYFTVPSQNSKIDYLENCIHVWLDGELWCRYTENNTIAGSLFDWTILESIVLPNSVTRIEGGTFSGCNGLNSIKVESGNEKYDSRNNCNAIIETSSNTLIAGCKNTIIPNSVTSIGNSAFDNCSSLTSITIPNSVTSIGSYAFSGCSGLTSVNIPNSVTNIGWYAFQGCSGLTKVVSKIKNPFKIDASVFPSDIYTNAELVVPAGTKSLYEATEGWNKFNKITEHLPTLVTQPAQPTSTTKARLIALANEEDDDQHFGFEWLRNDAPANMPANKVSAPLYDGRIIGSLGGLNPDIYYKYRPFYKSDAGEMVYGEWIPFLTGDANVFFEPETHTKEADRVTATGAHLSGVWIEGTDDIQEKGFEYWTISKSNTRAVGTDVKKVTVSGNDMTATLDGLQAGKEYGYRSYVKTASGTTYGEEKTFKTSLFGDVNGDNKVDNIDLNDLVSYIMGGKPAHFNKDAADLNNDKKVNAADIVKMVKILK